MTFSNRRTIRAAVCFLVGSAGLCARLLAAETPPLRPWTEYRAIMWIGDSAYKQPEKLPLFFQRLREPRLRQTI